MHRFYVPCENIIEGRVIISDARQIHHIKDVSRLKIKDEIVLFDEKANECKGLIEDISKKGIIVKIKDKTGSLKGNRVRLTVACAIPKAKRMDEIIDKLSQLGVDRIIPLKTRRAVVDLDKQKELLRLKRWMRIAVSASEQSGRRNLVLIETLKDINKVLSEKNYDLKLMPTLFGKRKTLKEVLMGSKPKNILILIGPEGDFTEEEIDLAKKSGCIPVSLGDLVLRVETAALAVTSFIRLYENS